LAGLANVSPKACVKLVKLFQTGELRKAQAMQEVVARGDWVAIQGGVVGTKAGLQGCFGYGGFARSPLPQPSKEEEDSWARRFAELVDLEESLE
jgi:dihydrodipicolinate synthase/N-acetylneuraminate lyase